VSDAPPSRVDERRPSGRRSLAFDVHVAVAAVGIEIGSLHTAPDGPSAGGLILAAVAAFALVWRRAAPVAVLAFTLALACVVTALGDATSGVCVLVALYTTAAMRPRRVSIAALVPTVIAAVVLTLTGPDPDLATLGQAIPNAILAVGIWGLGAYMQTRRRYMRELEDRAAYLEREREQLAQLAVMEERTSIARELHDIVAHSVAVMLVGVRGARDVLRTRPDVADDTLARVEASGEQSVAELRRILALLRDPARVAESRPQPSLPDLEGLVADHRASGLPVRLDVVGEPRPLPGGVELSVYRIVQEALTNVLKHTRANHVAVTLSFRGSQLEVEVVDDGVPVSAAARTDGHGLVGMRERVSLLGGELEFGRRTAGGFRVAARLPIGGHT